MFRAVRRLVYLDDAVIERGTVLQPYAQPMTWAERKGLEALRRHSRHTIWAVDWLGRPRWVVDGIDVEDLDE